MKNWHRFYKTSNYSAEHFSKWIRITNKRGETLHLPYATLCRILMAAKNEGNP